LLACAPAHIDASQTTATLTVYKRVSGSTVDSLTLTNAGGSGRFTYTYVGGAFWQRTVESSSTISGSFDAVAYGVRTPVPAVPRTGTGEYAVDLVGVESVNDNVAAVTGQGTVQVDFASGAVATVGTMGAPITGATVFSGEARLASSANGFTGTFRYGDFGELSGSINGAFYGPTAQEVGAAYAVRQGDGRVAAGVLVGRSQAPAGSNATVTNLTANAFLPSDAARLSTTLTGSSGWNVNSGTFSNSAAAPSAVAVIYDSAQRSYSLIAPDRSQYFGPDRPGGTPELDRGQGTVREVLSFPAAPDSALVTNGQLLQGLQYARAARWLVSQGSGGATSYSITDFAYGIATPGAAVPRTGTGGFVIGLSGSAADGDYANLMNISGAGTALVDFGAGTLTGSGRMAFREDFSLAGRATRTADGTFTLTAALSSAANGFSGTLAFTGIGNYSGGLTGRLFGPAAEEIGGSFIASDGSGGSASGSLVGRRDPSLTEPVPALRDLTGYTRLQALGIQNPSLRNIENAYFAYDADSRTYSYHSTGPLNVPAYAYQFGPAQAVAAETNATFSGYAGTGPAGQHTETDSFTASLFNPTPDNPRIALTYTSYADITVVNSFGHSNRQWVVYGSVAPASQRPRSGTGQYSGIVFGHGDLTGAPIDVQGSATLSVDFGERTVSSLVTLDTRPAGTGAFTRYGVIDYRGGFTSENLYTAHVFGDSAAQGYLQGRFFGPNAAEFGFLFGFTRFDGTGPRISVVGGAVGTRD
ncbi:MAG TPA: hypothetical protein VEA61_15485, partial [Allosphingosinicella sp.]|nr:hypothetical protein [Allosphingosinicella sp.]